MDSINNPSTPKPDNNDQQSSTGEKRVLSFGEQRARVSFIPSNLPNVDKVKQLSAALIDELHNQLLAVKQPNQDAHPEDGETIAQYTLAIRKVEEACMRGVGAATWKLGK